jgi:uncharacterized coiled-coil protein SlyX
MVTEENEYELIPMSPIRRLEQRLDRLESSSPIDSKNIFSDIIDIVRMNQQIVDELAKSSDALRIELSKLPAKMDELIINLKELVSFIRASGETESTGVTQDMMKPVVDKMDEMVKTNKVISEKNDSMLELLDEIGKKMRRPTLIRPMPQFQGGQVNQSFRPPLRPLNA